MNSIRKKLFFQIGSITLLLVLILYLANTFLLEIFYVMGAKSNLVSLYDQVNQLDIEDYDSDILYNLSISGRNYYDIIIIDEENNTIYSPINPALEGTGINRPGLPGLDKPPQNLIIENEEVINTKITIVRTIDPKLDVSFLSLRGILDNGYRINIQIPMTSISENVVLMNRFILIVGFIVFIISLIAANIISKHFTRPILNIFTVTNHLSHLDFSRTCDVITNDEIGRLAENVNEMSYALKDNLEHLAKSNQQLSTEIDERMKIDQQRKALLNNVSHELKTPLALVQGYSEGLKLNLHKKPEKVDFYCDVIIDEAKKMDSLVSQLLDMNHIQFGDFPLHKETSNAKDFLNYILKKYQAIFQQYGLEFKDNLEELSPQVMVNIDSLRSEQILTNLLNNAIAYCDHNKIIELKVTKSEQRPDHLQVTLSNSCQAMKSSSLEQFWNSFYKEDKARTRENGGYGLGLSIVKAIQEADHNYYGVEYANGFIHFGVEFDIA